MPIMAKKKKEKNKLIETLLKNNELKFHIFFYIRMSYSNKNMGKQTIIPNNTSETVTLVHEGSLIPH